MKQRPGFTLLELLTVIGVTAILVAVGFPSMQAIRQNSSLNGGAQEFISIVRQVQGQAVANQGGSTALHQVKWKNSTTYIVVSTSTVDYLLPSGVTFGADFGTIDFAPRVGTIAATKNIDLVLGSVTKHVVVSVTGLVTLQ